MLTLFSCQTCSATEARSEETLVLHQSSDTLGLITTYINKSAVKILMPDSQCYLITKAPTWNVVIYNAHNKLGFEMGFSDWMKHSPRFMLSSFDDRYGYLILEKQKLTWLQMPATKFDFPCKIFNGKLTPPMNGMQGEYITALSPLVSEKTCGILQKALVVPKAPGLPLYVLTKFPEQKRKGALSWRTGGDSTLLRTIRAEKKDVQDSFFDYPKAYKRKELEVDVLMDKSKSDAIEDVVNGMGAFKN